MNPVLHNPANQSNFVRAWTAINSPLPATNSYVVSESLENSDTISEVEGSAENYHAAILEAATRLVAGRRKPTKKRRVEATTAKANKRHKPKVGQKTTYRTRTNSEALRISHDQNLEQGPNRVHEPVKRYLLPTKQSRLNTVPKFASNKIDHLSAASESMMNGENDNTTGQVAKIRTIDTCAHRETSARSSHDVSPQISPTVEKEIVISETMEEIESIALDENLDVYMDTDAYMGTGADIDDSYFDGLIDQVFSDNDYTTPTSSPNNTSLSSISTAPSQSHKTGAEEVLNTHTVTNQAASVVTATVPAFLRKQTPDEVAMLQYSPIPRLVAPLKVSTCFRIAEALRLLKPAHTKTAATIELYAIITDFTTSDNTQTVRFADLFFPQRPPYISGSGRGVSKLFLAVTKAHRSRPKNMNGIICRAIIRSTKPGTTGGTSLPAKGSTTISGSEAAGVHAHVHVLIEAIRESDWEEIEYVRGIVDPKGVEAEELKRREKQVTGTDHVLGAM